MKGRKGVFLIILFLFTWFQEQSQAYFLRRIKALPEGPSGVRLNFIPVIDLSQQDQIRHILVSYSLGTERAGIEVVDDKDPEGNPIKALAFNYRLPIPAGGVSFIIDFKELPATKLLEENPYFNVLRFDIKGGESHPLRLKVRIEMQDGSIRESILGGERDFIFGPGKDIQDSWKTVLMGLKEQFGLNPVDLTNIRSLQFQITSEEDADGEGQVLISRIYLERWSSLGAREGVEEVAPVVEAPLTLASWLEQFYQQHPEEIPALDRIASELGKEPAELVYELIELNLERMSQGEKTYKISYAGFDRARMPRLEHLEYAHRQYLKQFPDSLPSYSILGDLLGGLSREAILRRITNININRIKEGKSILLSSERLQPALPAQEEIIAASQYLEEKKDELPNLGELTDILYPSAEITRYISREEYARRRSSFLDNLARFVFDYWRDTGLMLSRIEIYGLQEAFEKFKQWYPEETPTLDEVLFLTNSKEEDMEVHILELVELNIERLKQGQELYRMIFPTGHRIVTDEHIEFAYDKYREAFPEIPVKHKVLGELVGGLSPSQVGERIRDINIRRVKEGRVILVSQGLIELRAMPSIELIQATSEHLKEGLQRLPTLNELSQPLYPSEVITKYLSPEEYQSRFERFKTKLVEIIASYQEELKAQGQSIPPLYESLRQSVSAQEVEESWNRLYSQAGKLPTLKQLAQELNAHFASVVEKLVELNQQRLQAGEAPYELKALKEPRSLRRGEADAIFNRYLVFQGKNPSLRELARYLGSSLREVYSNLSHANRDKISGWGWSREDLTESEIALAYEILQERSGKVDFESLLQELRKDETFNLSRGELLRGIFSLNKTLAELRQPELKVENLDSESERMLRNIRLSQEEVERIEFNFWQIVRNRRRERIPSRTEVAQSLGWPKEWLDKTFNSLNNRLRQRGLPFLYYSDEASFNDFRRNIRSYQELYFIIRFFYEINGRLPSISFLTARTNLTAEDIERMLKEINTLRENQGRTALKLKVK